jgi:alpha-L-rhamnosidase
MVANMFLIHSLELMAKIAQILGHESDRARFEADLTVTRAEFHEEYVTSNGRLVSDSQAAYAIAICFDIFSNPAQKIRAGNRLVELVRKAGFRIGTGFAGTPFLCEALASTGHIQVAYSMLLETQCPSWLYPVTMGATTVWERWDSMLPDGSINPGEMTSFNHYAFGAVAKFLYERIAGLQRREPGWRTCRVAPAIGAKFTSASASHITPFGRIACSWKTTAMENGQEKMELNVSVPYGTTTEIILPEGKGERREVVGMGEWNFETLFVREYEWPVLPLKPKS